MMLDRAHIEACFRDGTADARAAVVWACPPHPFRDAAATLSQSDDVVHRVMAMGILATAYCHGCGCEVGAEIALAGHALGTEALRGGRRGLQPQTLSLLAVGAVDALRQLGRIPEALGACDRFVRYHEQLEAADPNVRSLRMTRVELLLELGRFREAEVARQAVRESGEPIGLPGLQRRIEAGGQGRIAGA